MNDALYEQLIARRPKPYDLPLRILIIFVIVAVAVFGTPFLGFLSFFYRSDSGDSGILFCFSEAEC